MIELAREVRPGGDSGGGGLGGILVAGERLVRKTGSTYNIGMGKGLSEPCSPYRQANVFGAELNIPNASNWNCVPQVINATSNFDLSTITPNHEVVVALSAFYGIEEGHSPLVTHKWYRKRDDQLLFTFSYQIPDPKDYGYGYWAWWYVYSYIGYVSWEIWENGQYYNKVSWEGSLLTQLNFNITGIPVEDAQFQSLSVSYAKV